MDVKLGIAICLAIGLLASVDKKRPSRGDSTPSPSVSDRVKVRSENLGDLSHDLPLLTRTDLSIISGLHQCTYGAVSIGACGETRALAAVQCFSCCEPLT